MVAAPGCIDSLCLVLLCVNIGGMFARGAELRLTAGVGNFELTPRYIPWRRVSHWSAIMDESVHWLLDVAFKDDLS